MNETRDQNVGKRIAFFRGDMPQTQLAEKMRLMGWKWSQSTVWAVEKGDRPVKFLEAVDLSIILKTSIKSLVGTEAQTQADYLEGQYVSQLDVIRDAMKASLLKQLEMMQWADQDLLVDENDRKRMARFLGGEFNPFNVAEASFVRETEDLELQHRQASGSGQLTQRLLDQWQIHRRISENSVNKSEDASE